MPKKKVCMVVGNTFTHDARVNKEAKSLARAGYEVVVYAVNDGTFPQEETIGGVKVKRLRITSYSLVRLNVLRIPTEFFPGLYHLWREKADIYHAHDADTLLICHWAAKKNKANLVYDFHEYWKYKTIQNSSRIGHIRTAVKNRLLVMVESFLVPKTDALITVNDSLANEFKRCDQVKEKPLVLFNVPSYIALSNEDRTLLRRKIGADKEDLLVLFLGGFDKNRGLENLVKSLDYLDRRFKLVFLGYGPLRNLLIKASEHSQYRGRVFVLDAVSPADVPKWASGADIGVAPIQNASWSYFHSSPNKIFECLMAGLPVACSDFPEMRKIVKENDVGLMFDPEDPGDIARALEELVSDESRFKEMRKNALKVAKQKYNWEVEEEKLVKLYEEL